MNYYNHRSNDRRENNKDMLQDTLDIFEAGEYTVDGKKVSVKLSKEEQRKVQVLLPEDMEGIYKKTDLNREPIKGRCMHGCENIDSFSCARKLVQQDPDRRVLVLNLASSVHPGGGVRKGATAQEEDLCRKSSLLLSLESLEAGRYYKYNRNLHSFMGSNALILTPDVEIIKDDRGNLLEESVVVSVMTCAAPRIRDGLEGLTKQEYKDLIYKRIHTMITAAAYWGYEVLVLGAFGCGAYGNDARLISDLFYKVLKGFEYNGMKEGDFFRKIEFAVLDKTRDQYNFKEFSRNFSS